MRQIRIGLAQVKTVVGDIEGNTSKIIETIQGAKRSGVDIVAFPEMTITGYPPEDLLFKSEFIEDNLAALKRCAVEAQGICAVVGFVDREDDLYNAAAFLERGAVAGVYHKTHLPNYGVFDENRYFKRGMDNEVIRMGDIRVGLTICEDIWYPSGPAMAQAQSGASLIINVNASPYHAGKPIFRERMLAVRAYDATAYIAYVNLVGGQDELVFDGGSLLLDPSGRILAKGALFEEDLVVADIDLDEVIRSRLNDPRRRKDWLDTGPVHTIEAAPLDEKEKPPVQPRVVNAVTRLEEVYSALVAGLRDYVHKNGFKKVIIGLSGGVDSALTAAIAVDALGREHVVGVKMPSRHTSKESVEDADQLASNLGIELLEIPIEPAFRSLLEMLSDVFSDTEPGSAEENLQARVRGTVLMALSNKFGWLLLSTANKSETAVGYTTLYGDMAGGFALLKDIPKTMVYRLAESRNKRATQTLIPERTLTKAPSAELRAGQKDSDSMPPYDILDPILEAYVERDLSSDEIVSLGFKGNVVDGVISMVDRNEYKRRQAPPGIKITPRAFGKDRRLPITNLYRGRPEEEKK